MLKKFVVWFIVFGLSFLISDVFGWTEQGKAFLYIDLGLWALIIIAISVILVIAGFATSNAAEAHGISFLLVLITARVIAITMFATWGATKLFDVDFYVTYQIMTFGKCLCVNNNNKDD